LAWIGVWNHILKLRRIACSSEIVVGGVIARLRATIGCIKWRRGHRTRKFRVHTICRLITVISNGWNVRIKYADPRNQVRVEACDRAIRDTLIVEFDGALM
jgi:hypothetical protein